MAEDTIILAVDIETKQAQSQLDLLNKAIEDGKKKQESLNQQFKEGQITLEEYNKASRENTKEIKANETATKNLTTAVQAESKSITALSAENKELVKQRNSISTATEEGRLKIQQLNEQIDKNNQAIRDNVSSLEKQKINIGNYASALDGVVPGLGGFIQGTQAATSSAKAFIATPFGAILAAIAIALGAVYKYLEKYEPILDIIENAVTQVTAAFDSFIQNLDLVGNIIGNVLTLNFSKAGDQAKELGNKMSDAAKEGQAIVDLTREIEDATIAFELSSSRVDLQIKRLLTAAKNRTLTAKQQQDILNQALELENTQLEKNLQIKKMQFEADVRSLIQSKKAQVDKNQAFTEAVAQNKTLQEQFEILAKSGIFSPDQLAKALESYRAIDQAEGESLAFQEKVQNQKDAIAEKEETRRAKQAEADAKRKIEQEKELARLTELQRIEESYIESQKKRITDLETFKVDQQKNTVETIKKVAAESQKETIKIAQNELEAKKKLDAQIVASEQAKEQQLAALRDLALSTVSTLFGKNKNVQVALTLISTYLSAQKAFESQFNPIADVTSPIRGAAAAALAITQGLARVAAIKGITDKTTTAPSISGGRSNLPGSISGITQTRSTTNQIDQQFLISSAFRNMPPIVASWKEATEVGNKVRFKEALTTA